MFTDKHLKHIKNKNYFFLTTASNVNRLLSPSLGLLILQLTGKTWSSYKFCPPSMGLARQEYWSGVPLPFPILGLSTYLISLLVELR